MHWDPSVLPAACPTPRDPPAASSERYRDPLSTHEMAFLWRWIDGTRHVVSSIQPGGRGGDQDESVGRDPPSAFGGRGTEEGDRAAAEAGRQDGAPRRRPADAAGAGVSAERQQPGPWRDRIEQWLREDRKLTAKRVRRLLLPLAGAVSPRTVRRYVAALRRRVTSKEAFVHRSVRRRRSIASATLRPSAPRAAGYRVRLSSRRAADVASGRR